MYTLIHFKKNNSIYLFINYEELHLGKNIFNHEIDFNHITLTVRLRL